MSKSWLVALLFFLSGLLYFAWVSFYIAPQGHTVDQGKNTVAHVFTLESMRDQSALINIVTGDNKAKILLNDQFVNVDYPYPNSVTSHKDRVMGDNYRLSLKSGVNKLQVILINGQQNQTVAVSQQYRFIDFLVGFIALLPLLYLLFTLYLWLCDLVKKRVDGLTLNSIPLVILATGILLRLWYALDMGYIQFQHDYQGHVDYIKFFAHEFFVPLPHKDWEFPQQPFYYMVNGLIYALLEWWGMQEGTILREISFITTLFSCVGLIYCYRLLRILNANTTIQAITLAFLCFMPSIIYMSSRINNDPWAFALACIAMFYIINSYQAQWQKHFLPALICTSLLFLTKVSALTIELLFFSLLMWSYFHKPGLVKQALLKFYLVGMLLLAYTVFRAYHPAAGIIELVNSGIWPGMDLRPLNADYFFSFNFSELLEQGQAYVLGKDNHAVTRSFLTYQYGNMIFGEFDYGHWRNLTGSSWMFINMQAALVLGLIVPVGWAAYCFRKKTVIDRVFIMAAVIAIVLVLRFAWTYPSVSNTDFRYYCPVFFLFAYFFACGIDALSSRFIVIRGVVFSWLFLFFAFCLTFMFDLIRT